MNIMNFDNSHKFLNYLQQQTLLPASMKILEVKNGYFKNKDGKQIPWGQLYVVDVDLYKKFEGIGQPESCPQILIKLRQYKEEDLSQLLGAKVNLPNCNLIFQFDKFKQPTGFALSTELKNIEVDSNA